MTGIRPEYFGKRKTVELGGDVGCSSARRAKEGPSQVCKLDGNSGSGSKIKEEEENATLAAKGQQEQQRQKKGVSKIKCLRCGEFGHYTT